MKVYLTVKRRMESRYQKLGEMPGILFLVSSKKSEHDFLEQYAKTVIDKNHVLIVDEPLWRIKPASNYSGKMFQVAVGDKRITSKIISEKEDPDSFIEQGFKIIDVPIEHREAFELDADSALQDIAGISSVSSTKFISMSQLETCLTEKRLNPFRSNILTIGLHDNMKIEDFFLPDTISPNIKSAFNFIHIDTSWKADITGISMISIGKNKKVSKYVQGSLTEELDATYTHVFTVGIKAPADSEISFAKTRDFIYHLRDIGVSITGISLDGYQSVDTSQIFTQAGFSSALISVDKTADPYLALRSAIAEERIDLLSIEEMEMELTELEKDNMTGKIDHPENGSKDLADSLCGAHYNATRFKMLPHLKHASGDATDAIDLYSADVERSAREDKNLLGIDGDVMIGKKLGDLKGWQDSDILDW